MFATQKTLFKAYDIRGNQALFTPLFIQSLAQAFVAYYQQHACSRLVIAYDARPKSQAIAHVFANLFQQQGIEVIWLGLATTPLMAYWADKYDGHGIIATASHSPADICGLKWLVFGNSPNRDDIASLYQTLITQPICPNFEQSYQSFDNSTQERAISSYCNDICQIYHNLTQNNSNSIDNQSPIHKAFDTLVIDCLNGATAIVAQRIFDKLAKHVIMLNDTPDGSFPLGNPDPCEPHRLSQLQQQVRHYKADLGLAFDGDGDRLAVVDSLGNVLPFDMLIYFLSLSAYQHSYQQDNPNLCDPISQKRVVLYDVKCVHTLKNLFSLQNIDAVMTKTGSSHLRRALHGEYRHALFAGELSGHFIFNDGLFIAHDDGVYSAVRLLAWLSLDLSPILPNFSTQTDGTLPKPHQKLQQLIHIHPKIIASDDVYLSLPCAGSPQKFVDSIKHYLLNHLPAGYTPTTIDGIRLDSKTGFGLVRASNTSHHLTWRFGADDGATFDELLEIFCQAVILADFDTANFKIDKQSLADFVQVIKTTFLPYKNSY